MKENIEKLGHLWMQNDFEDAQNRSFYCSTRDIFRARSDSIARELINKGHKANLIYLILAIVGEIGNNSFDHNLGNWPDIMGIFLGCSSEEKEIKIVLADRGQGVLKTLKRVKSDLKTDEEALKVAFYEKLSGRAPERRGNGLKFVRESVQSQKMHLTFISGNAQIDFNQEVQTKKVVPATRGCLAILNIQQ